MTEFERLTADLATNPELVERLARLPAGDVHAAASLLKAEGYQITVEDLVACKLASSEGLQPLTDSELDAVAGGAWSDFISQFKRPGIGAITVVT